MHYIKDTLATKLCMDSNILAAAIYLASYVVT